MPWPITKDDVREALKGVTVGVVSDAEAARWALVAMSRIEQEIGPHSGQSDVYSSRSHRVRREVALPHAAASVESITVDDVDVPGAVFDPPSFVVGPIPAGLLKIGWTAPNEVPPEVEEAAITLASFLARQRKISDRRSGSTGADMPQGFALPNAVIELLGQLAGPGSFA